MDRTHYFHLSALLILISLFQNGGTHKKISQLKLSLGQLCSILNGFANFNSMKVVSELAAPKPFKYVTFGRISYHLLEQDLI